MDTEMTTFTCTCVSGIRYVDIHLHEKKIGCKKTISVIFNSKVAPPLPYCNCPSLHE